ncbi:MAG: family 43 glycosylhydrolase [Prolixibacteraceae bacterium]
MNKKEPIMQTNRNLNLMRNIFCLLVGVTLMIDSCRAAKNFPDFEWQNPIHFDAAAGIYGDRLRDPHIIRVGDTYYLTHSMTPVAGINYYDPYISHEGSSPGVRLYSTKDFKTWKAESWIINGDKLPADCPYRHQHFAPEINQIGGKFYVVVYSGNWKLHQPIDCYIGVADKVTGPYEHITRLKGAGCDVTLTEDDQGKVFAFMIGNGIRVQEVDLSGIERGDIKLVGLVKTAVDITYVKSGLWHDSWTEGPWVKRRNGKYYLFYAVHIPGKDSTQAFQYWMAVSYADHPMGPWTQDPLAGIFWGGHGAVFDGPDGRWWYSYKNEKFAAQGEDFLCIDPVNFLPDGRIGYSEPTPFNILTRIASDGTVTYTTVDPKPVPVDQRPPVVKPKLLPAQTCSVPVRKILDLDFQRAGDGSALHEGVLAKGDVSLKNNAGEPVAIRAIGQLDGPILVKREGRLVMDTSGGNLTFPQTETSALSDRNSNKNFSLWTCVQFLRDSEEYEQTVLTKLSYWKVFRSKSGRLELNMGRHIGEIFHGKGPQLQLGRWYDIGFSFEGDADPADLHEDIVTVYLDGREVGKAIGRGMSDDHRNFQFGSGGNSGLKPFMGLYQRVIFWEGVVKPEEFSSLSGIHATPFKTNNPPPKPVTN